MSLIEQAAKRLEELRRSGADLDEARPVGGGSRQPENKDTPTPEAVIRALDARAAHARAAEAAVAADAIALHAALNGTPRPEAKVEYAAQPSIVVAPPAAISAAAAPSVATPPIAVPRRESSPSRTPVVSNST